MARYRLLVGKHAQKEENPETHLKEVKIYKRGDVFESKHDLLKFNSGPGAMKFEKVDDAPSTRTTPTRSATHVHQDAATQPPPRNMAEFNATLDKMNEKDLRALAAEEEIDLKGAKTKEDVLKAIKAATTNP